MPTCRKLGIGLVPYSPLGRGSFDLASEDIAQLDAMGTAVDGDSQYYLDWAER